MSRTHKPTLKKVSLSNSVSSFPPQLPVLLPSSQGTTCFWMNQLPGEKGAACSKRARLYNTASCPREDEKKELQMEGRKRRGREAELEGGDEEEGRRTKDRYSVRMESEEDWCETERKIELKDVTYSTLPNHCRVNCGKEDNQWYPIHGRSGQEETS